MWLNIAEPNPIFPSSSPRPARAIVVLDASGDWDVQGTIARLKSRGVAPHFLLSPREVRVLQFIDTDRTATMARNRYAAARDAVWVMIAKPRGETMTLAEAQWAGEKVAAIAIALGVESPALTYGAVSWGRFEGVCDANALGRDGGAGAGLGLMRLNPPIVIEPEVIHPTIEPEAAPEPEPEPEPSLVPLEVIEALAVTTEADAGIPEATIVEDEGEPVVPKPRKPRTPKPKPETDEAPIE